MIEWIGYLDIIIRIHYVYNFLSELFYLTSDLNSSAVTDGCIFLFHPLRNKLPIELEILDDDFLHIKYNEEIYQEIL